jgi:outer membrane autotransporter protein
MMRKPNSKYFLVSLLAFGGSGAFTALAAEITVTGLVTTRQFNNGLGNVTVTATGVIDPGPGGGSDSIGIQTSGDNVTITNAGTIRSTGVFGYGIAAQGANNIILNTGTITTTQAVSPAIVIDRLDNLITNTGTISTAQSDAIRSYAARATITNSGVISSTNGIGIFTDGASDVITNANTGTISTNNSIAIRVLGANTMITNAGVISTTGDSKYGISAEGNNVTITNTGTINAVGTSSYGVQTAGTGSITTLNNSQGAGNADGALTYRGALPANYNIIINSASSYGKLAVTSGTGTTTFGIYTGSTVANGTYTSVLSGIAAGNLTATTGSYNSVTWTLSETTSGSYIWNLIVSGISTPSSFQSNALTYLRSHAAGAAGMLDSLSAVPAMSGVMTALNNLSGAAQANAIAQTLPAMAGAASQATTSSMQALNQVIQGRSSSLRGMSSGDEYIGNRDVWMKGFGSWANQNEVNGVSGYKVNTGGLAIGIDKGLTRKANIGAVFAFSNSGVSSNSSSAPSGVTINSYQAGVYGDYAIHPQLIANAQVDIGMNQNNAYRNITFMGTNANSSYKSYSGHVGTGVKYLMPLSAQNTFIPSVRVDYTTVQSQAYTETGAGALNLSVGQQTYNTLIPSADLRIDHSLDSKLTLSANAGAGYNTLSNQVTATSAYQGGGTVFATNGLAVSPWLYNAGVGIVGQINKTLQLNVRYDNVFSPTGYMNQMVSAKLKIPF